MRRRERSGSLPAAVRRPALLAVAVAASVTTALGVRYAGETYPRWLDQTGLALARDWFPIPRRLAYAVIGLFDPVPLAVLVVVLVGVCLALGRRRLAVLVVAGPVAAGVATTVLKPVVDRTKDGDLAYPSGHMAAATALAVVAALLLVGVAGVRGWRAVAVLTTVPVLTGGTVGLAMTVTGYHYLTDAVGGFCIGVATVLGLALLIDRWPPRRATTGTGDQQVNGARNTPWPSCD